MHGELLGLLRRREEVIADHAWRDRDAADHLDALRQVSEAITAWAATYSGELDPRLRHFLQQASFSKARVYLEGGIPEKGTCGR